MRNINIDRRNFLKYTAAVTAGSTFLNTTFAAAKDSNNQKLFKAVKIGMLPGDISDEDKFKLAKRCGFDGIDGVPLNSLDAARKQADLARQAGVEMHGIVYGWWPPDPMKEEKKVS